MRTSIETLAASILVALLVIHIGQSAAATIEASDADMAEIDLRGSIQAGDSDRLLKLLNSSKFGGLRLRLDSPGGSVAEALKIAAIVEQAAMATEVKSERNCVSACFFVFLAGGGRYAASYEFMTDPRGRADFESRNGLALNGYLGIHRPFDSRVDSLLTTQSHLMRGVTQYLERQLLSRRLIDLMMARPSNDIYWLTQGDLDEISEYPPHVEEYLIQQCNYDRNRATKQAAAIAARRAVEAAKLNSEQLRSEDCQVEELTKLRTKGRAAIRSGWRPVFK